VHFYLRTHGNKLEVLISVLQTWSILRESILNSGLGLSLVDHDGHVRRHLGRSDGSLPSSGGKVVNFRTHQHGVTGIVTLIVDRHTISGYTTSVIDDVAGSSTSSALSFRGTGTSITRGITGGANITRVDKIVGRTTGNADVWILSL